LSLAYSMRRSPVYDSNASALQLLNSSMTASFGTVDDHKPPRLA